MRFRLVPVVLAVAVVVTAVGCGGSSKKSSAPSTAAPAATTTETAMTTTAAAAPTFASTKNCAQLLALGAKLAQALQATSGSSGAGIADEAKVFRAMADAAPSEIRGDFRTLAAAFEQYVKASAKVGLKAGQAPTAAQLAQLTEAVKVFSAPKLQAAEQHLSAWAQKNCGALPTTTTG